MDVETFSGSTFLYVLDSKNGRISACTVDPPSGLISNCNNTPISSPGWKPKGIAFLTVGTNVFAYVIDNSNASIWSCAVKQGTGALDCTQQSDSLITTPTGVTVAP